MFVYVLELFQDKYFIGQTYNCDTILHEHYNNFNNAINNGTAIGWTTKYRPIKLIETFRIQMNRDFDIDDYTIKYMEKYGINNVRGGSFCEITLSDDCINIIEKTIKNNNKNKANNDIKYYEYTKKFNNLQEINDEIIKLEKQFEYVRLLNKIINSINHSWKNTFNYSDVSYEKTRDSKHYIDVVKSKFSENIQHTYIDLDIFEKVELYNNNVRINKISLFKLQIENEIQKNYQTHEVSNISSFELEINRKLEVLTNEMLRLTREFDILT
jgi:hypothetical protein